MLLRRTLVPFIVVTGCVAACGSDSESVFDGGGGGGNGDGGAGGDGSTDDVSFNNDDGGGSTATCASQVLCGSAATCCDTGQECVGEACVAACTSGVRCGSICCPGGQVCLQAACIAPGASCNDSFDCDENEFCEPTIGKCLPEPTGPDLCVVKPPVPAFQPVVKWSWTDSTILTGYNQVINMPVVVDLDADKIPEVVIVTSKNTDAFNETDVAYVRALDGRNGAEKWAATVDAYKVANAVNPRATPAAADLDGDGKIEIVAAAKGTGLLAFRADGSLLWRATHADGTTAYTGDFNSPALAVADLDHDGKGEVIAGGVILNYQGHLVTDTSIGRERWGANDASYGAVPIVADVDGNAQTTGQQVVTGNRAIRRDGSLLWDVSATLSDGYAAIADLDKDTVPELVVTYSVSGAAYIRVQNALTGALIGQPLKVPGSGRGGPPTIADFDGDTFMEFASANGDKYNVFEFNVATKAISVKWSHDTQDLSSNVTGSSVFDFEGDGAAEVVYNDECYSRVFKGTDGTVLLEIPNSTGTIHEYPVIVDVNGDNHTEYVVVANDRNHLAGSPTCAAPQGQTYTPRHGVFVYGDPNNKWVRTRRVWNQHAYHITNIDADGHLPAPENASWGPLGLNNYRVSSQGKGTFNAPDLAVDLEVSTAPCPGGILLRARVKNEGSLGVPAGVKVDFYEGTGAQGTPFAEAATTRALLPGESEVVPTTFPIAGKTPPFAFFVTVDGGSVQGVVQECLEDNNSSGAGSVVCPPVK